MSSRCSVVRQRGRSWQGRSKPAKSIGWLFLVQASRSSPRLGRFSSMGFTSWAGEGRFAKNRLERLPGLAAELVSLDVNVIVAFGTLAPLAAKRATTTIPIVMANAGDP